MMGNVYASSLLTLAASDARDCYQGLLEEFYSEIDSPGYGYHLCVDEVLTDPSAKGVHVRLDYEGDFSTATS